MRLYNTLTKELEDFVPMEGKEVKFFVCGPTVYDYSHLGHGKTYTQFDFIVRSLKYLGFNVTYLVNITDIDDKIIARAKERGMEPSELAEEFEMAFFEDMKTLGNTSVDKFARAHDYIPQIVSQVERLVEKGFAYKISDGYYFDTTKFANYGKLSGRNTIATDDAVSRIDENPEKKNSRDFCLWKFKKEGEPSWEASIGEGRPGWHIEDTAITETEFGSQYDIHGGARDLIFPHHEAEVAQMEAVSGKSPFVKYWMHAGFLNTGSEKMSKSKGNFTTLRDAFQKITPLALRYYFLIAHYRSPMDFTTEGLHGAASAYRKLKAFVGENQEVGNVSEGYVQEFKVALEEDFNSPEALAVMWKLIKDESVSAPDKKATLLEFDKVLGLDLSHNEFEVGEVPSDVQKLVDEREAARKSGDWVMSDELRAKIKERGFLIEDSPEGSKLSKL